MSLFLTKGCLLTRDHLPTDCVIRHTTALWRNSLCLNRQASVTPHVLSRSPTHGPEDALLSHGASPRRRAWQELEEQKAALLNRWTPLWVQLHSLHEQERKMILRKICTFLSVTPEQERTVSLVRSRRMLQDNRALWSRGHQYTRLLRKYLFCQSPDFCHPKEGQC